MAFLFITFSYLLVWYPIYFSLQITLPTTPSWSSGSVAYSVLFLWQMKEKLKCQSGSQGSPKYDRNLTL